MVTDGDRPGRNISEPEAPTGAHGGEFVLAGPAHNYEYEPDKFAVKTILAVPIAVIVTGLLAFITTWLLFSNIFDPKLQEPADVPGAAVRNAAPLNDRFGRISSTDPNAEVQQPRLEGLEKTQVYPRDGDPNNAEGKNLITSQMTTTQATKEGNSPKYHAEQLRPDKVKALNTSGPDPETGTTKVPVDEAIKLLVDGKLLPAREGAGRLDIDAHWDRPKESNGGNAKIPEPAKPAAPKKADDKKGPEAKEGDKKGGEPEKK
jgi:hypothetical protein